MKFIRRRIKYYLIRLFRLKQGARQVALGLVFGFFPCWYPTFGVGPVLSIALTKLIRGNVVAAIISAMFGSFVWIPLFFMNYKIGNALHSLFKPNDPPIDIDFDDVEYTETIEQINTLQDYGIDFLIGALFNSVFFTCIGYVFFYFIFSKYREAILAKLIGLSDKSNG